MIKIENIGKNDGSVWQSVTSTVNDKQYSHEFFFKGMPEKVKLYSCKNENHKVLIKDNKVVAKIAPSGISYHGEDIEITYSNKQPLRKSYRCPQFGKLTILYKGQVAEIYFNGKKVGVFNTTGYAINKYWYKKRCKRKGVKPIEKLNNYLFEFEESYLPAELLVLLVRLIYGTEREMS